MSKNTKSLKHVVAEFVGKEYHQISGTAVYLNSNQTHTPPALLQNLKHNKVMHEQIVILTIDIVPVPRIVFENRINIEKLAEGFYRISAHYGFMDQVDITRLMAELKKEQHITIDLNNTSYILGRETLIPNNRVGMNIWQDKIFIFMSKNAQRATTYYNVPQKSTFEIGTQVSI